MNKKRIRAIFLFQFKLGRNAAQTARDINKAFGPKTADERTVQRWFKKFRSGDDSLEDGKGRGRTPSINDYDLKALVEADPRATVRKLAEKLGVSKTRISAHLKLIRKSTNI